MSVLITDSHLRTALYVIRSLGKKNIKIISLSEKRDGYGLRSKYCFKNYYYSLNKHTIDENIRIINKIIKRNNINVIIPINENSIIFFAQLIENNNLFFDVEIPIPSMENLKDSMDKWNIFKICRSLNIPMPTTYYFKNFYELKSNLYNLKFPLILKARFEANIPPGPNYRYKIINSPEDCKKWYKYFLKYHLKPPIIQELIKGSGIGFFALYDKNHKLIAFSGHKRIREQFPTGGPSTFCESYYNHEMYKYGTKILSYLKWYGVAMVEFKLDHDSKIPYLIEINPRFWGSTPLAIFSGIDFPYLLYKIAINDYIETSKIFKYNMKLRFLFDDIYSTIRYLKSKKNIKKIPILMSFFRDLLNPTIKDGILSFNDIRPGLLYFKNYFIGS
ncbi:MAG: carboxylate--amine ligase [Candidatus Helarchaeota archaeon]